MIVLSIVDALRAPLPISRMIRRETHAKGRAMTPPDRLTQDEVERIRL